MSPFLQLAFELVIILLAAKLAGYLAARLQQPPVLGELLAGVLLGPSLINILHLPFINSASLTETLSELSQLGVLLLMFIAGLSLHLGELTRNRRVPLLASTGGLLLSIGLGWAAGRLFSLTNIAALLLGVALGATSVSISARTLLEMGVLRSRVGLSLLGAAVVDDVLSLLALSILLAVTSGAGGGWGLAWLALRMVLFLALAILFGLRVLPILTRWVVRMSISQGPLVFAVIMLLMYGLAAELAGQMAALIGAFLAGLMFARMPEKELIEPGLGALAHGLFVPLFFMNIGLSVDLHGLPTQAVAFILVVTLVAVAGKLFGAAAGARLGGLPVHEAFRLGTGMVARGEVTLIVAAVGSRAGLLSREAFSAIVAVVLLSTLVTPLMLRFAFDKLKASHEVNTVEERSDQ